MTKLLIDVNSFAQITKEFLRALGQKRTYNFLKNGYCLFGILWGIPIPIVTIGIDLYSSRLLATLPNIIRIAHAHPFHALFLLHPIFFGIVFGAMGTVRHNKQRKIEEFEKSLIDKNEELEHINKRLQESDRIKSSFLSMVSHELRTPLTAIQGYISFLFTEKPGAINQTQRECLKVSGESADLLNHLIEELLDLSKIERGEFRVHLARVDMSEIVHKAILSLRLFAAQQEVIMENNLPKDPPSVWADSERILQVMVNLLGNAIKFNRKGGKVDITASDLLNEKVIFSISDTGIGIPEDKIDMIFDKFYQVDSSEKRRYGGCGLGLAISKSIIELHGGKIRAESKIGIGSKFHFELLNAALTSSPPDSVFRQGGGI